MKTIDLKDKNLKTETKHKTSETFLTVARVFTFNLLILLKLEFSIKFSVF